MARKTAAVMIVACAVSFAMVPGCATVRFGQLQQDEVEAAGSPSQVALRAAAADLVALTEERQWTTGETAVDTARRALNVLMHGAAERTGDRPPERVDTYLVEIRASGAPAASAVGVDVAALRSHVARVNETALAVAGDADADAALVGADVRRIEAAIRRAREAHRLFASAITQADELTRDERAALGDELEIAAHEIELMSARADALGARRTQSAPAVG